MPCKPKRHRHNTSHSSKLELLEAPRVLQGGGRRDFVDNVRVNLRTDYLPERHVVACRRAGLQTLLGLCWYPPEKLGSSWPCALAPGCASSWQMIPLQGRHHHAARRATCPAQIPTRCKKVALSEHAAALQNTSSSNQVSKSRRSAEVLEGGVDISLCGLDPHGKSFDPFSCSSEFISTSNCFCTYRYPRRCPHLHRR